MAEEVLLFDPATVDLEAQPIPLEWIVSGAPVGRNKKMLTTRDWTATVIVWDCTPGSFHWHYAQDEAVFVLSGEAFMTDEQGKERRFAAGDMGFFPAGYSCKWRVTETFRKVGLIKESIWLPLGLCLKAWNKLLRVTGLAAKLPLMLPLATALGAIWR